MTSLFYNHFDRVFNHTPSESSQTKDNVATNEFEAFETVIVDEKQKIDVSETKKEVKLILEELKEVEKNAVISSENLAEKSPVTQESEKNKVHLTSPGNGLKS